MGWYHTVLEMCPFIHTATITLINKKPSVKQQENCLQLLLINKTIGNCLCTFSWETFSKHIFNVDKQIVKDRLKIH